MNRRGLIFLLSLTTTTAFMAAERQDNPTSHLIFDGYMVGGESGQVFALVSTKSLKRSTSWVRVGDMFDGFMISSFEEADESLCLVKDGTTYILPLGTSKIHSDADLLLASAAHPGEMSLSREDALRWIRNLFEAHRSELKKRPAYAEYDPKIAFKWGDDVQAANEQIRKELEQKSKMVALVVDLDGEPFLFEYRPVGYFGPLRPLLANLTAADREQLSREQLVVWAERFISSPPGFRRIQAKIQRDQRAKAGIAETVRKTTGTP